jgi:hypothetical protein
MDDSITVETDMFEHREAKPHFINPCCFGEDFAAWLKQEISPLTDSPVSNFPTLFKRTMAGVFGLHTERMRFGWFSPMLERDRRKILPTGWSQ